MGPDERARAAREQMTDEERFSLLISVMGAFPFNPARDERIPRAGQSGGGYAAGGMI